MAGPSKGPDCHRRKKPLTLSPLLPSSLSPGEREEGEGSWGEGFFRFDERRRIPDSLNGQTLAASPAKPGYLPTD